MNVDCDDSMVLIALAARAVRTPPPLPPRDERPCAQCGRYGCDGTAAGHAIATRATRPR